MQPPVASIWIDDDEAVIRSHGSDGHAILDRLVRHHGESPMAFDVRVVDEVRDDVPLAVDGPDRARLRFERAYVSVTHRPDRLIDIAEDARRGPPRP
jgi:hypothetical protein